MVLTVKSTVLGLYTAEESRRCIAAEACSAALDSEGRSEFMFEWMVVRYEYVVDARDVFEMDLVLCNQVC